MNTFAGITDTRNQSIDLIKIVAITLVVALHTTNFGNINTTFLDPSFLAYNTGVVAIPLFFMVSGYLLLGRGEISFGYSLKKIWGIVRFMVLITAGLMAGYYFAKGWTIAVVLNFKVDDLPYIVPLFVLWYLVSMCVISK